MTDLLLERSRLLHRVLGNRTQLVRQPARRFLGAREVVEKDADVIARSFRRAVERLKLLTRDGRSQADVIEEALERMPVPPPAASDIEARIARLAPILDRLAKAGIPSMAEFDAKEYDEDGNCR